MLHCDWFHVCGGAPSSLPCFPPPARVCRSSQAAGPGGHLWDVSFEGWACVDLGLRALFFAEALGGVAVASWRARLSASTRLCAWCAVEMVGVVLSFAERSSRLAPRLPQLHAAGQGLLLEACGLSDCVHSPGPEGLTRVHSVLRQWGQWCRPCVLVLRTSCLSSV